MPSTSSLPSAASAGAAAASRVAADAEPATAVATKRKATGAAAEATAARKPAAVGVRVLVPGLTRAPRPVRATTARRTTAAGYATAATASKTDPLAFLRDPKLSMEDKLIKLLGYLNAKWEKDMQERLDRIAAGEKAATTSKASSSSSKKTGGLLGGVAGAFASALGGAGGVLDVLKVPAVKTALKKLGGPALAAAASALGFPAAAPALLKHGPTIVDAALGVASAAGKQAAKTSQATSTSTGGTADADRQTLMMEIQRIQEKQKEMFGLVSNILRMGHDTRMSIIGNVR